MPFTKYRACRYKASVWSIVCPKRCALYKILESKNYLIKGATIRTRNLFFISMLMSFMIFTSPLLAQMDGISLNDVSAGRVAGERAGQATTNRPLWFCIGCLGGWVGMAAAYLYEPGPPSLVFIGKSPEYTASYIDSYRLAANNAQIRSAWTGCITHFAAIIVVGLLSIIADSGSPY